MKSNPILDELWKVKDQLAAEAGYDVDRFLETLRRWETDHPHPGRVIRSAKELRELIEEEERKRSEPSALTLKDKPPRGDGSSTQSH
jgi:hypothetical protein